MTTYTDCEATHAAMQTKPHYNVGRITWEILKTRHMFKNGATNYRAAEYINEASMEKCFSLKMTENALLNSQTLTELF